MRFYKSSGGENGPPRRLVALAALVAFFLAGSAATPATANTITLSLTSVTTNGSNFDWNYDAFISGGSQLDTAQPSTFTLFDFSNLPDFVALSTFSPTVALTTAGGLTATFLGSVAMTGPTYALLPLIADNAGFVNVTFTYSGATTNPALFPIFQTKIGSFSVTSTVALTGPPPSKAVLSRDEIITGVLDNNGAQSTTVGPALGAPTPLPLPVTAMAGTGLFALLGGSRRRRGD